MGGSKIEGIYIVRKSNDAGALPDMAHGVVREAPVSPREDPPPSYLTLSSSPSRAFTRSLITTAVLLGVTNLRGIKHVLVELSTTGILHACRLSCTQPLRAILTARPP